MPNDNRQDRLNQTWNRDAPRYSDVSTASTALYRGSEGPVSRFGWASLVISLLGILFVAVGPGLALMHSSLSMGLTGWIFGPIGLFLLGSSVFLTRAVFRKYARSRIKAAHPPSSLKPS